MITILIDITTKNIIIIAQNMFEKKEAELSLLNSPPKNLLFHK